jgi:dynein heavy chain, axonemal
MLESPSFHRVPDDSLWNYKINVETKSWEPWEQSIPPFVYNPNIPYFETLVPTSDTARYGHIAKLLFQQNHPVLFTGATGVGKSVLAKAVFNELAQTNFLPVFMNFSAQTSSLRTQEMIEARLEKRKKTLLGPPLGKRLMFFVDDVNMPKMDRYGSQPPIELLRQFIDFKGFYDRDKMYWKDVQDVVIAAACAPPGGGRNPLSARFVRHFAVLMLPAPNDDTMKTIFKAILNGLESATQICVQHFFITFSLQILSRLYKSYSSHGRFHRQRFSRYLQSNQPRTVANSSQITLRFQFTRSFQVYSRCFASRFFQLWV